MDEMLSSFRIMSPTSFVYGESVEASNFIQLEDLECHFQPLNITLQVLTPEDALCHWEPTEGPAGMGLLLKAAEEPGSSWEKLVPA